MQKIGRRDYHFFGAMHITLRGLRVVDVGIIYPILGKVLFQISFTNYENILAHNTSLVTSGSIQIQILYCINNLQSQEDGAIMTE